MHFQILDDIKSSKEFKDWQKKNNKDYLAHFFGYLDNDFKVESWEVGFYNPKKDSITTFKKNNESVEIAPEQKVLKEKSHVDELSLKEVKINHQKALQKAKKVAKKEYPQENFIKGFIILQHVKEGLIWNITLIGQSFKTLNIKISAQDGQVITHDYSKLFEFDNGKNPSSS